MFEQGIYTECWYYEGTKMQLVKAKPELLRLFEAQGPRPYRRRELESVLRDFRNEWHLSREVTFGDLLQLLTDEGKLREIKLESKDYSSVKRYVWGDASPYQLALSIRAKSYLSHGTAVFLRGLSEELPKVIYVNAEQSPKPTPQGGLVQGAIDRAFASKQRQSRYVFSYGGYRMVVLSGKHTGGLEVGTIEGPAGEPLRVTKVERTLIDIAVRPAYSGGVAHVQEVFENAREGVSSNVLLATLKKLDYKYPYHQSLGFLMERAGYSGAVLGRLRALGIDHDFYLMYGMKEKSFDENWRLFYPKGL